jgi:hypothetical protein
MLNSDVFVFHDDIQFEKQCWQQRNRIVSNKKEYMLSVPVKIKHNSSQKIYEIETVQDQNWKQKHLNIMNLAYKKHPFGLDVLRIYEETIIKGGANLCRLNTEFIIKIKEMLGLKTEIVFSSSLNVDGRKSEKVYNLCKKLNASTYLSAAGSKEYIDKEGIFSKNNFKVIYQNYIPQIYPQKGIDGFIPYMSVVDLLANVGFENALYYIEAGYKIENI